MAADATIRDEACRLEDTIESAASAQFLSQSDRSHGNSRLYLNLHHLRNVIYRFVEKSKKIRAEYVDEIYKPEEAAAAVSSMSGDDDDECDMVGFSRLFLNLRDFLTVTYNAYFYSVEITGMAGMGKTTVAKKLFHDPLVKESFECRAFVVVGQKYKFQKILGGIIAQQDAGEMLTGDEDENASQFLKRILTGRRSLIVLDDVWDMSFDRDFTSLLPENCDGSFVLITSRIESTFMDARYRFVMPFLNEDEGWELLEKKVFGEEGYCPPPLVKAGKKIAEKCEGLPLLIITVAAQLLSKAPKNQEYWKEVAEMNNSVFEDAMDQIYDVLLRNYHFMIQNSKACFLYMGVFPHSYVFRRSRITNLWHAERFGDGFSSVFYYIISSNLAVVREERFSTILAANACNLHIVYRHLNRREAEKSKFLHISKEEEEDSSVGAHIKDKRRLAIYHNTLLAIKEVHKSIDSSVSTFRFVHGPVSSVYRFVQSSNLPQPPPGTILPNLLELLDVGVPTCTREVLESRPNLEDMSIIAQLPSLQVLKMQFYAFGGEKWEAEGMKFEMLTHLMIQDTDLAQWTAVNETFSCLRFLTMKNCHKLKDIPPLETLFHIVLLDCNPSAEAWANRKDDSNTIVQVKYSWK